MIYGIIQKVSDTYYLYYLRNYQATKIVLILVG